MEKVKVGQTSLLGYLPAILLKKILKQKEISPRKRKRKTLSKIKRDRILQG